MHPDQDPTVPDPTAETLRQAARFLRVVWHRRAVMLLSTVVCAALGTLYYGTAPRIYEATAQMLIVDTSRESLGLSVTGGREEVGAMATYEKLVTSPLVLEAALRVLDPQTRRLLGPAAQEEALPVLAKALQVKSVRQTNLMDIGFRSPHREATAAIVAAIIRAYATFMDESHRGTAGTLVDLLKREKDEVDRKIEAKQAEFLGVRQRVGDLGIKADGKTMHPLVERAIQLNAAMIDTQKRRVLLQASYQSLSEAMQSGRNIRQSLVAIEETLGKEAFLDSMGLGDRDKQTRVAVEKQLLEDRAQLETLLEYYGDNHPKVIERRRKIEQMEGYLAQFDVVGGPRGMGGDDAQLARTIATILHQRLEAAQRQEQWLAQSFEQAKQESIGLTSDMSRLDIVEHDLRWLRELRNTLLNQIASVDLRQENGGVRTTVVREPTVPLAPVSPKLSLTILAVLAAGLVAGVGIVFVIDTLDDRARSPEELRAELGLPVLATIGLLDDADDHDEDAGMSGVHMHVTRDDDASESFRTLRTVLVMGKEESQRVAVSSAEPSDGKTTVSTNLAVAYQQAGKRVLMIDGDMRKPGLTKLVGRRGEAGLSDLLRGTGDIAAAKALAKPSGNVLIDVIPAGRRPPNPGELLLSERFAELLSWAEANYDQVIVDAPPILAGTDAAAIGRICDGLVMVIRPEKNHRRVLVRAVETLRMFGVHLFGTVVNAVGIEQRGYGYGYGYGHGYGYGYGYGYGDAYGLDDHEAEDDDDAFRGGDDDEEDLHPRRVRAA